MSDTPRTDEVAARRMDPEITDAPAVEQFVPASFARLLERELNTARANRPEVTATKIRNDALEEAAQIALRRTEIPRDARNPTRDQVVIVGEEIAAIIRDKKQREPQ